jgi:hypothetical protein
LIFMSNGALAAVHAHSARRTKKMTGLSCDIVILGLGWAARSAQVDAVNQCTYVRYI